MLFGLKGVDPLTLVLAAGGMTIIGVAASAIPASRAPGVDPMNVLREERAFSVVYRSQCTHQDQIGNGKLACVNRLLDNGQTGD